MCYYMMGGGGGTKPNQNPAVNTWEKKNYQAQWSEFNCVKKEDGIEVQ